jgi:ethanolamine ammonia-lyase small subunit
MNKDAAGAELSPALVSARLRAAARQRAAASLRAFTPARVGLGRTGVSQQARDVLAFQLAHARARDAVHARMDAPALQAAIANVAVPSQPAAIMRLHSAASDRATYLQRPDLGRRLDENSRQALAKLGASGCDLAIVVADGLSALAVERHVPALLAEWLPRLAGWKLGPLCIVEQGRVAIADEIGFALHADLSVVLIGERPGLSSPDSLGAYITWQPRPGRTDAERNCISNIREEGLACRDAAEQLVKCCVAARQRRLTGTAPGGSKASLPEAGGTAQS